jgi:hypothetical protein
MLLNFGPQNLDLEMELHKILDTWYGMSATLILHILCVL